MDDFNNIIWPIIILLGIFQGLILSGLLLFGKRGNRTANVFLGATILLLVWHHLQAYSIITGLYRSFPHFYGADYGSLFLFGPLIYFYISALTYPDFRLQKFHALHLIPFLVLTLVDPVIFLSTNAKIEVIEDLLLAIRYNEPFYRAQYFSYYIMIFSELIHLMIYLGFSVKQILRYSEKIKNKFSNIDKINLNWLKTLTISFSIVILLSFLLQKLAYFLIHYYYPTMDHLYILPVTVFIYVIGFNAMRNPVIFSGAVQSNGNDNKYSSSSLKTEDSKVYLDNLLDLMRSEKPYLDPELKLVSLSVRLNIPSNHLSQVINEQMNLSFFDFINRYRIDEAKDILKDRSTNDTLLKIAFDVGFNNKVSFNNYFKKLTGMTPSQFRDSSQIS